jgi:hypothetical protein
MKRGIPPMFDQSYATSFVVDQTAEQVVDAINDVRGWWSEDVEGSTDKLGEEFVFRGKDIHYSKIQVAEFIPATRIVWLVLDNYINFVEDQGEWKGTRITFEVLTTDDGTELRFRHVGLVPEYECFDVCSNAWGFFINSSLRSLITTGKGEPMEKARGDQRKALR